MLPQAKNSRLRSVRTRFLSFMGMILCSSSARGRNRNTNLSSENAILPPSLNRLHGKAIHIGNTPNEERKKESAADKIKKLKLKLADAIKAEEFEDAAKLRDEIRALEGEENNA